MSAADDLYQTVEGVEAAASRFITGDPALFKEWWSHTDDITIMGAWGGYEQGWEQVGPRLDWAAGRFGAGQTTYEPLALGSSGDLAYAIGIERGKARVVGSEQVSPIVLRVTHILRREDGVWKIIHRHADHVIERIEATAILQP